MEYNTILTFADKALEFFQPHSTSSLTHSNIISNLGFTHNSPESGYILSGLKRLVEDGYLKSSGLNNDLYDITGTTFDFKAKGGYKTSVKEEEERLELKANIEELNKKSTQSVIDTNTSIQTLNTKTADFYTHQSKYNNTQKLLTIAIFFTGAVSAVVATCEYYKPSTTNSGKYILIDTAIHNKQLRQLENNMKSQTNRFETFEKAVKDSLNMK
jgi:hypothetical protein